jgi:hypothetical protein
MLGMPSDGQLVPNSTIPSIQLIPSPEQQSLYHLSSTDEGPFGNVRLVTTAEVTGDSSEALPEATMRRIVGIYIMTRLSDKYLVDACDSLTEILSWQINEALQVASPVQQQTFTVPTPTRRQQAPFTPD